MTDSTLTIRRASETDRSSLRDLAVLDSSHAPSGEVLVAQIGSELWAAVEVETGAAIADPFRPSGDLVELLRFRAQGIRGQTRGERGTFARLLPRAA
jgi:hypothetical protein